MYKFVIKNIAGKTVATSSIKRPTAGIAQIEGNKVKNAVDKFKYCTVDVICVSNNDELFNSSIKAHLQHHY